MRYLVDMIVDLKNNRERAKTAQIRARIVRLSAWLAQVRSAAALLRGGAGRRDLNALNVGWGDFANAGTEGRWWLVGAKWRGSQHGSNTHGTNQVAGAVSDGDGAVRRAAAAAAAKGVTGADKLLRLAALHRMNTDVRRSVFSIVMVSASGLFLPLHFTRVLLTI